MASPSVDRPVLEKEPRVTTRLLQDMKRSNRKIAMLTAYDFTLARIVDAAGIDVILVGDSASNVMAGHETTLPITLDQMIYHAAAVVRAARRALVVVDLPFGSYQGSPGKALASAVRVMKESGAHAVKLEGGAAIGESVRRIVCAGIPVMGHLGLTPQSIHQLGSHAVRARDTVEAERLRQDARALQQDGCFALVVEKIPALLGGELSRSLEIPVIGIGAGADVDGQVLVLHDMLGITVDFNPRFVRRYGSLNDTICNAVGEYARDVRSGAFPGAGEAY